MVIVPLEYSNIEECGNGIYKVAKHTSDAIATSSNTEVWGFLSENGIIDVKPMYKDLSDFAHNFGAGLSEVWSIVNERGEVVNAFHEDIVNVRYSGYGELFD